MKSQQERPASFISKLYNILRAKQHGKIIYWDTDHQGIRIINQKKLEEIILPKYFRHNRFSSFVRQLNMYDFHKVHMSDHKSIFLHKQFDPKKKESIHLIKRKVTFSSQLKVDSEKDQTSRINEEITMNIKQNQIFDYHLNFSKATPKKSSIRSLLSERNSNLGETNDSSTFQQIIKMLLEQKATQKTIVDCIRVLKSERAYKKILKQNYYLIRIYERLGLEMDQVNDCLSQLSIQNQLACRSSKSMLPKSMKMVQSGPLYFKRDTFGNLMNA